MEHRHCLCEVCVEGSFHREPSPERRANKPVVYTDIFHVAKQDPSLGLFPEKVQMFVHQIRAQQKYREAAQAMNEVLEEMSIAERGDRRNDIRDRLRRKLAQKRKQ